MTGEEIKKIIQFNNQKIESMLDPSTFVLQPEVKELLEENEKIRKQCSHVFKNNTCIYCQMVQD